MTCRVRVHIWLLGLFRFCIRVWLHTQLKFLAADFPLWGGVGPGSAVVWCDVGRVVLFGVVMRGVVWCGVVWRGGVWRGVAWRGVGGVVGGGWGVVWCGAVW